MPIDFSEFEEFNYEKIKEWEKMSFSEQDIARWKEQGVFVEKLYEFKMKKLFLEYLRVKLENESAKKSCEMSPFSDYDPILEAEKILKQSFNEG